MLLLTGLRWPGKLNRLQKQKMNTHASYLRVFSLVTLPACQPPGMGSTQSGLKINELLIAFSLAGTPVCSLGHFLLPMPFLSSPLL